jgi:hypothetical protein
MSRPPWRGLALRLGPVLSLLEVVKTSPSAIPSVALGCLLLWTITGAYFVRVHSPADSLLVPTPGDCIGVSPLLELAHGFIHGRF